jgi:phage gp36-like protein
MGAAYCTSADFLIPAALLATIPGGDVTAAIEEASRYCDSFLVVRYEMPLAPIPGSSPPAYPAELAEAAAAIATYRCLRKRGFNPDGKQSETIRQAYNDAKQWLRDVVEGKASALVLDALGYGETPTGPNIEVNRVMQAYPSSAADSTLASTFFSNPSDVTDEGVTQQTGVPKRRGW